MKPVSEMTISELAAELKSLDRIHGAKDPNGRKKEIRKELIKRRALEQVTGQSRATLHRNPEIRREYQECCDEGFDVGPIILTAFVDFNSDPAPSASDDDSYRRSEPSPSYEPSGGGDSGWGGSNDSGSSDTGSGFSE
jgi:hypothetical protein